VFCWFNRVFFGFLKGEAIWFIGYPAKAVREVLYMSSKSSLDTLQGRVALVTGASGGIGASIAARLAEEGAAVALGYGGNVARANALSQRIVAKGGRAVAVRADLCVAASAVKLADMVESALGPVDILVCSAGLGKTKPLEEVTVKSFSSPQSPPSPEGSLDRTTRHRRLVCMDLHTSLHLEQLRSASLSTRWHRH